MELLIYKDKYGEYTYYLDEDRREILHGLNRFRYKNGQLEAEWNYKDGKKHGLHRDWYQSGQLNSEYRYKDRKRHGPQRDWYADGQIMSRSFYWQGAGYGSKQEYKDFLIANRDW